MRRSLLVACLCLGAAAPSLALTPRGAGRGAYDTPEAKPKAAAGKININTAPAAELMKLPGIGESKAADIIKYREANGPFKTVDDLGKVKGIGPKTLEKFRDQLTVGGAEEKPGEEKGKAPPADPPAAGGEAKSAATGKININTATAAELMKLPGIGETKAADIIKYRETNGPFKTVDDLGKVKGIGPKTLEKFRDQLTVGGADEKVAASGGEKKGEAPPAEPPAKDGGEAKAAAGKININTAPAAELMKLPGIGESKAADIIKHRETSGPFKTCQDLTRVKGIGPKTVEKFQDICAVN